MLEKPPSCVGCPLHEKGRGFVPDSIVENPDYVFIGEAPGENEIEQGKPFVGQAGAVLKNWLIWTIPELRLAYEKKKISICNTLRCLPPEIQGRAYPRGAEKEASEQHCSQYNNLGSAKTVVLFGESAQRRWFAKELEAEDQSDRRLGRDAKGVLGRVGRVYERDNRRWVFAPHPAAILRSPSLVEHGQIALKIAVNTDAVADIDYVPWNDAIKELQSV